MMPLCWAGGAEIEGECSITEEVVGRCSFHQQLIIQPDYTSEAPSHCLARRIRCSFVKVGEKHRHIYTHTCVYYRVTPYTIDTDM